MEYPDKPGVYLFLKEKEVLYVGKAHSLKKRLKSYFQKPYDPKVRAILSQYTDVELIVCENEIEALILENNLIKKYSPKYNIRLKDDKRYPYVRITYEVFPRISLTRRLSKGRYFGPFGDVGACRKTLKFLRKLFPYRTCRKFPKKECLYYHLGQCPAPCVLSISREDYLKNIENIILFLEGKHKKLLKNLKKKMFQHSERLEFEKALELKKKIEMIERMALEQKAFSLEKREWDVLGIVGEERVCVQILHIRGGKLVEGENFLLEREENLQDQVVKRYYSEHYVPREIIISKDLRDKAIPSWLQKRRKSKVVLTIPKRGKKKKLLKMAEENASLRLRFKLKEEGVLEELKEVLGLKVVPKKIEAFDVSNLFGEDATASSIFFENGLPLKKNYRHYKLKVKKIDDYEMMREVVLRRYRDKKNLPDLILIDGGKGQLSSVSKVLSELELEIPSIGLAKRLEEIHFPYKKTPLILKRESEVLKLLQNLRDEAHRFALSYHRKLRSKRLKKSLLDEVEGVGKVRKRKLLRHFHSLENLEKASLEEIYKVVQNLKVAKKIKTKILRD
ncbi:MAG: excinuclease ABC subunit UvrC [Candidatus Methanofastidiosia archaeon]